MLGAKRHETLIGEEELFEFLPRLAYHPDDPNGDPVCLPVYYVSKLIRDSGVIMAQVGEGADEIFSGYDHYLAVVRYWQKYIKKFRYWPKSLFSILYSLFSCPFVPSGYDLHKEVLRRLARGEQFFWGGAIAFTDHQKQFLFTKEFQEKVKKEEWSSWNIIKQYYDKIEAEYPEADFLQKMVYLELKIRLPELLLMRVDKMSMAHGIEARVPFLDHRIVELAMQIPMDQKIKNMRSKHILKEAVSDKVPENIINRKKQGFGTPIANWLQSEPGERMISTLMDSSILKEGYFHGPYVEKLVADHRALRVDNSFRIWNLISLVLFWDQWAA
jgi:asparagine synthase (glutamine-hydrolysing)